MDGQFLELRWAGDAGEVYRRRL